MLSVQRGEQARHRCASSLLAGQEQLMSLAPIIILSCKPSWVRGWQLIHTASPRGGVMHAYHVHDWSSMSSKRARRQYMHAYYLSARVSEGLYACDCLHAARVHIYETFAARAQSIRAHTYEHDGKVCRKLSLYCCFLDEFPRCA